MESNCTKDIYDRFLIPGEVLYLSSYSSYFSVAEIVGGSEESEHHLFGYSGSCSSTGLI